MYLCSKSLEHSWNAKRKSKKTIHVHTCTHLMSSSSSSSKNKGRGGSGGSKRRTNKQSIGEKVNPEIVKCIQTLMEERQRIARIGDRMLLSYRKALKSLHMYPLKLYSGRQARILDGIGPVLADKIDQYLQEHHPELLLQEYEQMRQRNQKDSDAMTDGDDDSHMGLNRSGVTKQRSRHTRTAIASAAKRRQGKKKKKRKAKYVPRFKSAAWAMMITMYCESKRDPGRKLSKKDIIQLSQHLTDTPMLPQISGGGGGGARQEHGRQYYCGWTSMNSTLIKKRLVLSSARRPYTYELTLRGRRIARGLYTAVRGMSDFRERFEDDDFGISSDEGSDISSSDDDDDTDEDSSAMGSDTNAIDTEHGDEVGLGISSQASSSAFSSSSQLSYDESDLVIDLDNSATTALDSSAQSHPRNICNSSSLATAEKNVFVFRQCLYNGFDNKPAFSKDEAQVKVSAKEGLLFQVMITIPSAEVSQIQQEPPTGFFFELSKKCDWIDDYAEVIGWIKDEIAAEMCSGDELLVQLFPDIPLTNPAVTASTHFDTMAIPHSGNDSMSTVDSQSINGPMGDIDLGENSNNSCVLEEYVSQPRQRKSKNTRMLPGQNMPIRRKDLSQKKSAEPREAPPRVDSSIGSKHASLSQGPRIDYRDFCSNEKDEDIATLVHKSSTSLIPSSQKRSRRTCPYQVVLVVDPRERQKGTGDRGSHLVNKLTAYATDVKVEQHNLIVGDFLWVARHNQNAKDEFVLDFIVERKAMDDLAGSIMDNRFREQKYRLLQTKCRHVWYLVEGIDTRSQDRLPPETLDTAIINTQFGDGFFVKRTLTLDKSLEFLVLLTRKIQDMLQRCMDDNLIIKDQYAMRDPEDGSPITLRNFNATYSKQANNPVKIFGRQLCHVKGISASMAQAIVHEYPSPMKIWKRLKEELDPHMLADVMAEGAVQGLSSGRRLGPNLSQFLYDLYTADTY